MRRARRIFTATLERDSKRSPKGFGKKIARLAAWAKCVVRNGEAPPLRANIDDKTVAAYEELGVTILNSGWEEFIAALFFKSVESAEAGIKLNFRVIELWCERVELDVLETYDVLNAMLLMANKEQTRKIEQESKKIRARGKKR